MDSVVFCFAFADAVCPLRNRAAIILRLTNAWAAQADALIADRICAGDGCLQTRATRRQRVELRFYAFLFDLQLATSLRTQVFRVGAPNASKSTLNVFRLEFVRELLQVHLQFSLPSVHLD